MKVTALLFFSLFATSAFSGPVLEMNKAFNALVDLIPYMSDRKLFMEKESAPVVEKKLAELQSAFKLAGHDKLIKSDLFAPSYALINENIQSTIDSFKNGKKDYAHWRLKEITAHCLDCHTKLPPSYSSSFQDGDLVIDRSKFKDSYNLGLAQFIVRRYVDAKNSFKDSFNEKVIKKEYSNILLPIKQLVLIDTKVEKNPDDLKVTLTKYLSRKDLPDDVRNELKLWLERVDHWRGKGLLTKGLQSDKDVDQLITKELRPLREKTLDSGNEIDLLFSSGLLSNYLFENTLTKKAPEIDFWLGWMEKYLQRENYFGSGDLFLKQCIRKYASHPIAKECFKEYKESVIFDFSGSGGTDIPPDAQKELEELRKLVDKK